MPTVSLSFLNCPKISSALNLVVSGAQSARPTASLIAHGILNTFGTFSIAEGVVIANIRE